MLIYVSGRASHGDKDAVFSLITSVVGSLLIDKDSKIFCFYSFYFFALLAMKYFNLAFARTKF